MISKKKECVESHLNIIEWSDTKVIYIIMLNNHSNSSINSSPYTAKQLDQINRQKIAISALNPNKNISQISRQYETSRKFIYAQKEKASDALNEVFSGEVGDSKVLFYISSYQGMASTIRNVPYINSTLSYLKKQHSIC